MTTRRLKKTMFLSMAVVSVTAGIEFIDFGEGSSQQQFQVWNSGCGRMQYQVTGEPSWLKIADGASGASAGPGDRRTVTLVADRSGLPAGTHQGQIQVTSVGPGDSKVITVSMTVPAPVSPPQTATPQWHAVAIPAQAGSFTARFDATPQTTSMTGCVGLLSGEGLSEADCACLVRFGPAGQIEAWNGGGYGSTTPVSYAAGQDYRFRLAVDVPARKYSIYVTPIGGGEVLLASDYAFRVGPNQVSPLDHWALQAMSGSLVVRDFNVTSQVLSGTLRVESTTGLTSSGPQAGPFEPASLSYTLSNPGDNAIEWTAGTSQPWLSLSKNSGTLAAGGTDAVTVSIGQSAAGLPPGTHAGGVTFANLTNGGGTTIRNVTLTVKPAASGRPMTTASRTSGVAPLAVFFDAVGPASGVVQPSDGDYAAFHYVWDFGDPGSGHWTTGRRNLDGSYPSRNSAVGYVAAHVFESPGSYRAKLHVIDAAGRTYDYSQDITVQDPETVFAGTRTLCVSATGDFTGAPPGALKVTSGDFDAKMRWLLSAPGPARILLRSGDTFTSQAGVSASAATGPYTIGRFGEGPQPVISSSHGDSILYFDPILVDIRLVDLNFRGSGRGQAFFSGKRCLVLRCDISRFDTGVTGGSSEVAVVDSRLYQQEGYGIFCASESREKPPVQHAAVLGNDFDQVNHSHLLRTYIARSIIACNSFHSGAAGAHQLKFCGVEAPYKSEYSILSDNVFAEPGPVIWMVSIGPENTESPQAVDHLIVERNVWKAGLDEGRVALQSRGANNVTVRNNIFLGIDTAISASAPVPGFSTWINWKILNNTHYQAANTEGTTLISGGPYQGLEIRNNILSRSWGPGVSPAMEIDLGSSGQIGESHNIWHMPGITDLFLIGGTRYTLSEWQSTGNGTNDQMASPEFTARENEDLRPAPGSPALDAGFASPYVREDIEHMARPRGARCDVGAHE